MRQPPEDRALYYRQLRATVANVFLPELTSATAMDAAGLVDRILVEFIVEEEQADALSAEFGSEFAALLGDTGPDDPNDPDVDDGGVAAVTSERFYELRRRAADIVSSTARSEDAAERERCLRVADVERRFLERMDQLRGGVFAERPEPGDASSDTECSLTGAQLTDYLRRQLPDSPDLSVTRLEVVPGGRSKETVLVSLTGAGDLPAEIIVRRDRPVGLLQTRAADEFAVLQAVHTHGGVPVPQPFFADEQLKGLVDPDPDGEVDGTTLLVMAQVSGHKAGEYFPDVAAPTAHCRALGEQLAAALAHLHAIPLECLKDTSLELDAPVTEQALTGAVEGMAARIGELSGPPIAAVPLARQWLLDHMEDVVPSGRLCLLWGDVGLHNMLVDGDHVTALVDWEAATIGPPARELAAAWPAATALMEWHEFVDTYRTAGGPAEATDERALTYYRVFFALGAVMSSRTGGHLFRSGAKRDLLTAHSGLDAHFRAQRNLARTLWDAFDEG
jgi:aminoglycoside phosphotransferase (APT) family kinase protein